MRRRFALWPALLLTFGLVGGGTGVQAARASPTGVPQATARAVVEPRTVAGFHCCDSGNNRYHVVMGAGPLGAGAVAAGSPLEADVDISPAVSGGTATFYLGLPCRLSCRTARLVVLGSCTPHVTSSSAFHMSEGTCFIRFQVKTPGRWSVYLRWFPLHGATALSSAASLTVGRPAASGGSTQGGGAAGRAFCVAVQRFASFFITRPTPLPQRSIAAAVTVGRGALATMRADAPMVLHADVDAFANAWRPVLATMVDPAGVSHATGEREARVLYTVMTGPIARVIDAWQGTHCAGALPWFRPATR